MRIKRATALVAALILGLLLAAPAGAHVYPAKLKPGDGAVVGSVGKVSIKFTGQIKSGRMTVKRKNGNLVAKGSRVNAVKVAAPIKGSLAKGKYKVVVRIKSADGHKQDFDWTFKVK